MGCDIHIFTEYRNTAPDSWRKDWTTLGYHFVNPGRNYDLFNKLSGVRGGNENPIANPGWPADVSWAANSANQVYIREDEAGFREGTVDPETAKRWVDSHLSRYVQDKEGKNIAVTHPDWHSHGHCSIEQMSKALRKNSSPEYRAMLAAARSLEKDGMEVRFLFFYDN